MPKPNPFFAGVKAFFTWLRATVEMICTRPDHLQRLGIIGAGVSLYPVVIAVIAIIWRGYERTPELQTQSLSIMGFVAFGLLGLYALVTVALIGIIKGVRFSGPGGMGLELTTTSDDPDVDPTTVRETRLTATVTETPAMMTTRAAEGEITP